MKISMREGDMPGKLSSTRVEAIGSAKSRESMRTVA